MRFFTKLIPFLFIILLSSCAEEEDCIGCNLNPKIKLKFEPVEIKKETDSLYTAVKAEMVELTDSLKQELTEEQKKAVEEAYASLKIDSGDLAVDYNLFRANKIQIREISAPGSFGLEIFEDSVVQIFGLPVNMNKDTSTFYISYYDFEDTLQLYYQRDIIQNLEGVRMQLNDIGVNWEETTFDSLKVKCNKGICSNGQTTVYIYF